jgi:hypothetical protein
MNPGSNLSYYYQYAPCATFPNGGSSTPTQTIVNASTSGTFPPISVGNLQPDTEYCVTLCIQDDTAGSGFICTPPNSFRTLEKPDVDTNEPYNTGL